MTRLTKMWVGIALGNILPIADGSYRHYGWFNGDLNVLGAMAACVIVILSTPKPKKKP